MKSGDIFLSLLDKERWKWPVYPEVVSTEDNLWESLVGEEHVDGRGVRYLASIVSWSVCQFVSLLVIWLSDHLASDVWSDGQFVIWSVGQMVRWTSGLNRRRQKRQNSDLSRMVCFVLHASIGFLPLQTGELVGRTHWGHKICSSDKPEKNSRKMSVENFLHNLHNLFELMYFHQKIVAT